jgi:hypothetical protein
MTMAVFALFLPGAHAGETNRVGLVVSFGDNATITRCVAFDEPQISGYDVLMRSGLEIIAAESPGLGAAVCAIEDTGCMDTADCFCAFPPDYWSYWHLADGAWQYSGVGTGSYKVSPGDVEGWNWGPQAPSTGISFADICEPAMSYRTYLPAALKGWPLD